VPLKKKRRKEFFKFFYQGSQVFTVLGLEVPPGPSYFPLGKKLGGPER